jgi:hypothetical protein
MNPTVLFIPENSNLQNLLIAGGVRGKKRLNRLDKRSFSSSKFSCEYW